MNKPIETPFSGRTMHTSAGHTGTHDSAILGSEAAEHAIHDFVVCHFVDLSYGTWTACLAPYPVLPLVCTDWGYPVWLLSSSVRWRQEFQVQRGVFALRFMTVSSCKRKTAAILSCTAQFPFYGVPAALGSKKESALQMLRSLLFPLAAWRVKRPITVSQMILPFQIS